MEIKIQLPNPDDYQYHGGVAEWFSQMRISLKAAEKTYQEATKGLTEEDEKDEIQYQVSIGIPYQYEEDRLMGKEYPVDGMRDIINNNLYVSIWSV